MSQNSLTIESVDATLPACQARGAVLALWESDQRDCLRAAVDYALNETDDSWALDCNRGPMEALHELGPERPAVWLDVLRSYLALWGWNVQQNEQGDITLVGLGLSFEHPGDKYDTVDVCLADQAPVFRVIAPFFREGSVILWQREAYNPIGGVYQHCKWAFLGGPLLEEITGEARYGWEQR